MLCIHLRITTCCQRGKKKTKFGTLYYCEWEYAARPEPEGALVLAPLDRANFKRARSRLYRGQLLQVNMRLKALVEIYTMELAQLQNHIFFKKIIEFAKIKNLRKFSEFLRNSQFFKPIFCENLRLQRCKRMQIL